MIDFDRAMENAMLKRVEERRKLREEAALKESHSKINDVRERSSNV